MIAALLIAVMLADLRLVGAAAPLNGGVRLTPAQRWMAGAAWFPEKQTLTAGFSLDFSFQLTERGGAGGGADGFAFVIQNQGASALAGRGSAGGFALGDGYGDWSKPGIPRSVAIFFDTFKNPDAQDPSGNYVAVCTNGQASGMKWPPQRLALGRKLRVRLKDGRPHTASVRYQPPLLSLSIDGGPPEFRVPVDLAAVVDSNGRAYIGFTASTGEGYENHIISAWEFTPAQAAGVNGVAESEIHYLPENCLPGRNLCTPAEALVEQKEPGRFEVTLPGHLAWAAAIPNPGNRPVTVSNARGTVCFETKGNGVFDCNGPAGSDASPDGLLSDAAPAGALIHETRDGVTRFSVNLRKGAASSRNQGLFEFQVTLR